MIHSHQKAIVVLAAVIFYLTVEGKRGQRPSLDSQVLHVLKILAAHRLKITALDILNFLNCPQCMTVIYVVTHTSTYLCTLPRMPFSSFSAERIPLTLQCLPYETLFVALLSLLSRVSVFLLYAALASFQTTYHILL